MGGIVPTAENRKELHPLLTEFSLFGFKEKMALKMDLKDKQYSDRCGLRTGTPNGRKLSQDMQIRGAGGWGRCSVQLNKNIG